MHRSHTVPDIESAMGSPRPPDLGVDRSRAGDAASSQAGGHGSSSRSSSLSCARRPRWPARRSALSHVRALPASPSRPARTWRVRARGRRVSGPILFRPSARGRRQQQGQLIVMRFLGGLIAGPVTGRIRVADSDTGPRETTAGTRRRPRAPKTGRCRMRTCARRTGRERVSAATGPPQRLGAGDLQRGTDAREGGIGGVVGVLCEETGRKRRKIKEDDRSEKGGGRGIGRVEN